MTGLQEFASRFGPVVCEAPPCSCLTEKGQQGTGLLSALCRSREGRCEGEAMRPCQPPWGWQQDKVRNSQRHSFREDTWGGGGNLPTWRLPVLLTFSREKAQSPSEVEQDNDQLQHLAAHGHFLQLPGLFPTDHFIQKSFKIHLRNISLPFKNIHIFF